MLLKNETDYEEWLEEITYSDDDCDEPLEYPCYVFLIVNNDPTEHGGYAKFIYYSDLLKMTEKMMSIIKKEK